MARDGCIYDFYGKKIEEDIKLHVSSHYKLLCPRYVKIIARASKCKGAYHLLCNHSIELSKKVEEIFQRQTNIDQAIIS